MNSKQNKKKKIVIAEPMVPIESGGSVSYVRTIAEKLKEDFAITIVTYSKHPTLMGGIRVKTVPKNRHRLLRLFFYTRTLIRASRNANLIYLQKADDSGISALIAKWITKTPLVFIYTEDEAWRQLSLPYPSEHQGRFRKRKKVPGAVWLVWHIQHTVLRFADVVVAPSEYLQEELVTTHALKPKKVHVNYVPENNLVKLSSTVSKKTRNIFVSTPLLSWKDVATAVRTVALLREHYPDVTLTVAGEGPDRTALEELIEDRGLEKNVQLLGEVSTSEHERLVEQSTLFFSPAMYEDRPNIFFHAIELGVPVALTDIPGQRELFEHKKNALLIPPGNALACSDIFASFFEDKKLQKKLTTNAKKLFSESFSWQAHCKKLKTIFNQTMVSKY